MKNTIDNIHLVKNDAQCPFKKLNKRFQGMTKGSISNIIAQQQTMKHKEYVSILKQSFQRNEEYFINIKSHILSEDIVHFNSLRLDIDLCMNFFDTKLKQYFWSGFGLDSDNLSKPEDTFVKIGNLGLEDVTAIVKDILLNEDDNLEKSLSIIEEEIDLRLKNNVLIDSILHLDEFPYSLISQQKNPSAELVRSMMQQHRIEHENRFSPVLVPEIFREPMMIDGMIDDDGVVPQLTFGCPIINLDSGRVFQAFVIQFVTCFLEFKQKIQ